MAQTQTQKSTSSAPRICARQVVAILKSLGADARQGVSLSRLLTYWGGRSQRDLLSGIEYAVGRGWLESVGRRTEGATRPQAVLRFRNSAAA